MKKDTRKADASQSRVVATIPAPPLSAESKPKAGRPCEFTEAIGDAICEWLEEGKSLNKFCEQEGMPSRPTVNRWCRNNDSFHTRYALARKAQADAYFDQSMDIADDGLRDYAIDPAIGIIVNHDHINRARLRVDTRKWAAAHLRPSRYGTRSQLELTGKDGGPIKTQEVGTRDRNLDAIEALSSRIAGTAPSETPAASTGADDPEPEPGANT